MSDKPSFNQIMQMAQQMQKNIQQMQQDLSQRRVVGVAGTGDIKVEVTMDGEHIIKGITATDGAWKEGKEITLDLIAAAANDASKKVKLMMKDAMSELYKQAGTPFDDKE